MLLRFDEAGSAGSAGGRPGLALWPALDPFAIVSFGFLVSPWLREELPSLVGGLELLMASGISRRLDVWAYALGMTIEREAAPGAIFGGLERAEYERLTRELTG